MLTAQVHPSLARIINALPLEEGTSGIVPSTFSVNDLLPSSSAQWLYDGSLTTPPCTQEVLWVVRSQPQKITWDLVSDLLHNCWQ
jgi:carbonic anhydrase